MGGAIAWTSGADEGLPMPAYTVNALRHALRVTVVALIVAPFGAQAADPPLDLDQPYTATASNPVTYNISISLVFTPPYHTKKAAVWMVRPPSLPGQEVSDYTVTPAPTAEGPDPLYGNSLMYFQFNQPNGAQILTPHYKLVCSELHWDLDPAKVLVVKKYPPTFDRYLRSEQKVVVNDQIQAVARRIVGDSQSPFEKARKVILYVIDALTYGHDLCSLQASSLHALSNKHGHCSDYHGFSTALLRAVGVPARVAYGIEPVDRKKASPSHCKLEVYLAPYGWVNFDVSETDKLLTKLEQDETKSPTDKTAARAQTLARLFGGFKDNTWYRMTAGTDYPLVPAPAAANPPLIRTAYIECDGEPLPDPDPSNPANKLFAWHLLIDWGREAGAE
ncbi:MAG: transglutaminase [Armatimonadetes bacterium CG06_land_8_20_14_3_00_66_21]|nr:MAG: transglutaminase [Armatimonadetes bacterium CG06_land_8_20_14_3_00_66_21]